MRACLESPVDVPKGVGSSHVASETELRDWVEEITGGEISTWRKISGGNRCKSWAVGLTRENAEPLSIYLRYQPPRKDTVEPYTVWREARIYNALRNSAVPAPKIIAVNAKHEAIVTELAPGRADFRRIKDSADRRQIAIDFTRSLAELHAMPLNNLVLDGFKDGMEITDCVRNELQIWRDMYQEVNVIDPLIEFALDWLLVNLPQVKAPPCLVHGDAGPGNFLFDAGHMTALLDWELAHPGDPMEDLAWFSMRNVMEPVPDFADCLRHYADSTGSDINFERLLYHRVFVSVRVVIIRHRNVSGEPGNSIVSKSLNRRLLIDAMAAASGIKLSPIAPMQSGDTKQTVMFDDVLDDLKDISQSAGGNDHVTSSAKNSAKVLKYLREVDRFGVAMIKENQLARAELMGCAASPNDVDDDMLALAIRHHDIEFEVALKYFAKKVAREAQLAARSSGGLAGRHLPKLT